MQCSVTLWTKMFPRQCQLRGIVERDGKIYCRRHDPTAKAERQAAERQAAEDAERQRERANAAAIDAEGKRLLELLGVGGRTYYHVGNTLRQCGVREAVVISFEDARKLIERLK